MVSGSLCFQGFADPTVEMEVARYRALKLLVRGLFILRKPAGRNGGSPIQGIETLLIAVIFLVVLLVEMEVARYRALKLLVRGLFILRKPAGRNGGSPIQGIETPRALYLRQYSSRGGRNGGSPIQGIETSTISTVVLSIILGRNGGSPIQGIETDNSVNFNPFSQVEMEVARYRALKQPIRFNMAFSTAL